MKPKSIYLELPSSIKDQCNNFISNYKEASTNILINKFIHNNTQKDSEEDLQKITEDIFKTL